MARINSNKYYDFQYLYNIKKQHLTLQMIWLMFLIKFQLSFTIT